MKHLNKKLFITAVILSVINALGIILSAFGIVLPEWSIYVMGGCAIVSLLLFLLFFIRKQTGADQWDSL